MCHSLDVGASRGPVSTRSSRCDRASKPLPTLAARLVDHQLLFEMQRMTQTNEPTLPEVFNRIDREAFLGDVARIVEEQVEAQRGVAGFAIKGAYRIAQGLRADFPASALRQLFPAFAWSLGDVVARKGPDQSYEELFTAEADRVTEALLSVADGRVRQLQSKPVRAAYEKIRNHAGRNVRQAAPRIGRALDRHAR